MKSHIHSFSGTDLDVYKMGNTSERVAAVMKGQDIYICELLQHDEYIKRLPQCKICNYNFKEFELFHVEENIAMSESEGEILSKLMAENNRLNKELKQLKEGK